MRIHKIIFAILLFLIMAGGTIMSFIAGKNIVNYEHPYLFASIFVILGIGIGIKMTRRINSRRAVPYDYQVPLFLSIGFVGLLAFLGCSINKEVSYTAEYEVRVVDKVYHSGYRGSPGGYSLFFYIGEEKKRLVCGEEFGKVVKIGNEIEICYHTSKVGFNFITSKRHE